MHDPHGKPPRADEPSVLASLSDFERGLSDLEHGLHIEPSMEPPVPAPAAGPAVAPPAAPDADSIVGPHAFVDLFPPSALVSEPPPGPLIGTAVGPNLPPALVPRRSGVAPIARPQALTYETFYGLAEKPFDPSPDPKFFFHSHAHERVAAALLAAIRQREGAILLTGERGIGKTTLCRAIVDELDRRVVSSVILESIASADALLEILLVDFGVMSRDELARGPLAARGGLDAALASFFESLAPLQASAVVILDEAHRQPPDVLERLRALAASGPSAGLLQILLVAQPSFAAALRTPALRTIDAAIATRLELGPLAADEIGGYILHRLAVAGTHPRVAVDEAAQQRIFDLSRGVPGIVNLICDRALAGGFARSAGTIDAALVDAEANALGVSARASGRERALRAALIGAVLLASSLAGAAAAAWVLRDALALTIEQWEQVPAAPRRPPLRLAAPLAPLPAPDNPPPPPRI